MKNAQDTADWIAQQGGDVAIVDMSIDDPTDLDKLLAAIHRLLRPYAGAVQSVAVCPTSGTPQIMEAATLAASALFPGARFYQAQDPYRSEPPHFREEDPETVRHLLEAQQGFAALRDGRFIEAALFLGRRARSGTAAARSVRQPFRAADGVARALAALGALDLDLARRSINEVPGSLAAVASLRDWIGSTRPGRPGARIAWAVELGSLSLRESLGGRPTEAVLRGALAVEVAISARLREAHGIDSEDVTPEQARLLDGLQVVDVRTRPWRIRGARNLRDALATLDDSFRAWLSAHGPDYDALVEARNDLAHKGKAPPAGLPDSLPGLLNSLSRAFGWSEPSACPSCPAAIAALARDLASRAGITLE
jgi:hypothetical protein